MSQLKTYALSKKGKATSSVEWNPNDPPESYSNSTVHSRITSYVETSQRIDGPGFNPYTEDISGEAVMQAGGSKQHGRYCMANSMIDSGTTPTLNQIRARARRQGQSVVVRPRPTAEESIIQNLQVLTVSVSLYRLIIT